MTLWKMEHSRQLLSITSAAVDALSSVKDFHKDKRAKIKGGLQQATSSIPSTRQDATQPVSSHTSSLNPVLTSTADDRVVNYVNGDLKDQSSSSLLDLTFNGTQRVRVPSRLLREIKSPLERSSSSSDSRETPGEINIGKVDS